MPKKIPTYDTIECTGCKKVMPATEEFFPKRDRTGYPYRQCRACKREVSRLWRRNNPERYKTLCEDWNQKNPEKKKLYGRKSKYKLFGITLEDYEALFDKQLGKCAICEMHQDELKRQLAVDHCHTTGKIRGLLCNNCNLFLGAFKDNKSQLYSAIKYLQEAYEQEKENQ